MLPPDSDAPVWLRQLTESYKGIRLARGVVGKTSYALMTLLGLWAIIVFRLSTDLVMNLFLGGSGLIATAIFIWWTRSTQLFAERNPAQAILEGAQLLEYKRFEAQAKGNPQIASSPPIKDPSFPVTSILSPDTGKSDE